MKYVIRIIVCLVIMYSIANPTATASEWDIEQLVDLQKEWTVTFSEAVDIKNMPANTIVVTNDSNEVIATKVTANTEQSVNVSLVEEYTYEPNRTYTLTIKPFTSVSGALLNKTVQMTFTTAGTLDVNPEFLPKVAAVPLEAYNNQALVTLSYDDGYMNWYTKALRLHAKYNMPGTFNINTYQFDEGDSNFMSYGEVWVAADRGIEIGAHTHNHQRLDLNLFSEAEIRDDLMQNIAYLNDLNIDVKTIAAPNSAYSEDVKNIVKDYFVGARVFGSQLNTKDNYDPLWLKAYAVTNTTTVEDMQQWIDEAVAEQAWLIIMLHNVVDETTPGCANGAEECDELYDISTSNLEALMTYINDFSRDELLPVNTYEGLQMTSSWAQ